MEKENLIARVERRMGITDKELAQECGWKHQSIQKARLGINDISPQLEKSVLNVEKLWEAEARQKGHRLAALRRELGISVEELSRETRFSVHQIKAFEAGTEMAPDDLIKCAEDLAGKDAPRPERLKDGRVEFGAKTADAQALATEILDYVGAFVDRYGGDQAKLGWFLTELQHRFPLDKFKEKK